MTALTEYCDRRVHLKKCRLLWHLHSLMPSFQLFALLVFEKKGLSFLFVCLIFNTYWKKKKSYHDNKPHQGMIGYP